MPRQKNITNTPGAAKKKPANAATKNITNTPGAAEKPDNPAAKLRISVVYSLKTCQSHGNNITNALGAAGKPTKPEPSNTSKDSASS
jgi:hypothetical protein